jgi:hypothetical protein
MIFKNLESVLNVLNKLNYIPGITPFNRPVKQIHLDLEKFIKEKLRDKNDDFDGAGFLSYKFDRYHTSYFLISYLKIFKIIKVQNDKIILTKKISACNSIDEFSYLILSNYYINIYKNSIPSTRDNIIKSINSILRFTEDQKKQKIQLELKIDKKNEDDFTLDQILKPNEILLYKKFHGLWIGKIWFVTPLIRINNIILKKIKNTLLEISDNKLNNTSLSQQNFIAEIFNSLHLTMKNSDNYKNEETMKNIFFSKIFLKAKKYGYEVHREEYLKKHINYNGEADFYIQFKSNSKSNIYSKEIVIEFKFNCTNEKLIKHDIDKLLQIKKLNPKIAPIFINYFTKSIDFVKYFKTLKLLKLAKVYEITIAPGVTNFTYKSGKEILEKKLVSPTFISSSDRFQSKIFLQDRFKLIATPGFESQRKKIALVYYLKGDQYKKVSIPYCSIS